MQNRHSLALLALTATVATLAAPAHAQSKRLLIGPQVGVYTPTSRIARDRFGGSWTNIGIGLGAITGPKSKGEFNFDVNFISSRSKDKGFGTAEAVLAPVGIVYRRGAGDGRKNRPYYGASGNVLFANIRSNVNATNQVGAPGDNVNRGWRTAFGGSLFGGVTFGQRFYVEGRYYQFNKLNVGGNLGKLDLSGMNIALGWRL